MSKSSRTQKVDVETKGTCRIVCPQCRRRTKHTIVVSVDTVGHEEWGPGDWIGWEAHHQVVECQGCEEVSFRKTSTSSEDVYPDEDTGEYEQLVTESLYPPRVEGRAEIAEAYRLPGIVRTIYKETVEALASDQPILCGIGIRALIEAVCVDQQVPGGTLFKKIDALVAKKVLSEADAKTLHKVRNLGNNAAHEIKPHNATQLGLAVEIVERLLEGVYTLHARAEHTFD